MGGLYLDVALNSFFTHIPALKHGTPCTSTATIATSVPNKAWHV